MESQGINTHHQEAEQCGENEMSQLFGKSFGTRDDLLQSTKSFYLEKRYATTIKKSKKDRFVRIGCDRGGAYRNRQNIPLELRKRKSSSRLINCPFEVVGRKRSDGTWILQLINDSHNHEASSDMAGHPTRRRFSGEEMQSVEEMASSGIPPRQILSSLRQKNPDLRAVSRNVYNSISKIRAEKLGGRTMVQALFEELGQGEFLYNIKHDENGCLTHIFFAHPTSIILTRSFPHVFVMDCTYKTNKYKMPLLDIIGVSCFNTSFYSCFTFMEKEREEDYVWAFTMFREVLGPNCQPLVIVSDRELALMNAIRVVFPSTTNLLCVWHLEKNILSNCKRYFEAQEGWDAFMSSWNGVIRSSSEIDFEKNWRLFEELYKERREVLTYIEKTWLPLKERFVDAWAEKFLHFGHRVSSRAEGAHAKLKAYLQVSTGDFRQVKDKICLAITSEFQELKASLSSGRLRIPHNCNNAFFKEVVTKVSMHAMKQLYKQYEMVKHGTMDPSCTGHFTSTMGLPCAHKMMTTWKDGVLPISSIHSQWRIDSLSLTCTDGMMTEEDNFKEMLRELQDKFEKWPLMHKEKVRDTISQLVTSTTLHSLRQPSSGSKRIKGSSSTQRDPSRFEIVEKRRKCSGCKSSGHDIRTCPSKNKVSEQISYPIANSLDERGIGAIDLNMVADLDFDSSFN